MAFYQIETIEIHDKALVPVRLQYEGTVAYQTEHEVEGGKEVIDYTGKIIGSDSSTRYLRLRTADGIAMRLKKENILSVEQDSLVEAGSTIYFGNASMVPPNLGKVSDVYISKKGDCYSKTDIGWKFQTNICGPKGDRGDNGTTPHVGDNNNWFIGESDTGVAATGPKGDKGDTPRIDPDTNHWFIGDEDTGIIAIGQDGLNGANGITPHIKLPDKHWWIGDTDTGIVAEGQAGKTPYIGDNGNWYIGSTDTNIAASGASHMPAIDPISKHWFIDGTDTGILAEGRDGVIPVINPANKHWMIDGADTGICAEGVGGTSSTIDIDTTTLNWVIDGTDTGISAVGTQGIPGQDGRDGDSFQLYAIYTTEEEMDTAEPTTPESSFVALVTDNDVKLYAKKHGFTPPDGDIESRTNFIWIKNLTDVVQIAGIPGRDGITPHIDPASKHWMIGTTDTGISAEPKSPFIGANGNWWVGTTDTNISASGTSGITPHIDPASKHWMIGTTDTGVVAQASLPSINPTTFNWVIDGTDTGISAKGTDGTSPHIGANGNWWVGTTDTNVSAVVDTADIDALKARLNSLGASKHSMGEVDYFWCSRPIVGDSTALINMSGSNFNLIPHLTLREGNLEVDGEFIKLRANRTYKLTASLHNNTTISVNYFFQTADNKKSNMGVCQKGEVSTLASMIVSTNDSPLNVALYASVVDGSSGVAGILGYASSIMIEEICNPKDIDPVEYIVKEDGIEDTPVGTVISYMGELPPTNYLACDGTIYNISDYPDLAAHFVEVFGEAEHYGGDGLTTFAVPDLRGEFLRGVGEATRASGSGSTVGEHQDGTNHVGLWIYTNSSENRACIAAEFNKDRENVTTKNYDTTSDMSAYFSSATIDYPISESHSTRGKPVNFTARPTNTSVLYCIKYKKTPFLQIGSDIKVSEDADNQIEEREDGIYVAPTDTTNLQQQMNKLHASKFIETNIGFCQLSGINTLSLPVNSSSVLNESLTVVDMNSNIEFDSEKKHHFKLVKDKTYRIYFELSLTVTVATISIDFNAATLKEFDIRNSPNFSYSYLFTPSEDGVLSVSVKNIGSDEGNLYLSQSILSIEEISNPKVIDPVNYAIEEEGVEDVPVGAILPMMSPVAPKHYLICDGTIYNISDYPKLAEHFQIAFGAINKYGGDGLTTFAVPDLRGEFLRGVGKNGSTLGDHQEPTHHMNITVGNTENLWIDSEKTQYTNNVDMKIHVNPTNAHTLYWNKSGKNDDNIKRGDFGTYYASRPSNTSITWIIKCESTPFVHTGSITYGNDIEISKQDRNAIIEKEDGIYVEAEETYTDAEVEEAILAVFYPDRVTTTN